MAADDKDRSRLLALPAELRNRIYRFALVQDSPVGTDVVSKITWKQKRLQCLASPAPALLSTCCQIRAETLGIYYGDNTFGFTAPKLKSGMPGVTSGFIAPNLKPGAPGVGALWAKALRAHLRHVRSVQLTCLPLVHYRGAADVVTINAQFPLDGCRAVEVRYTTRSTMCYCSLKAAVNETVQKYSNVTEKG